MKFLFFHFQNELKAVSNHNLMQLRRLLKAAKEEMIRQELRNKLQVIRLHHFINFLLLFYWAIRQELRNKLQVIKLHHFILLESGMKATLK